MRINFYFRRLLFLVFDGLIFILSLNLTINITQKSYIFIQSPLFIKFFPAVIAVLIYLFTGQYKGILKYVGSRSVYSLLLRNTFITLTINIFWIFNGIFIKDFKFWFLFYIFNFLFTTSSRFLARDILLNIQRNKTKIMKVQDVIIYGAGEAGALLSKSILNDKRFNLVGFIDDDKKIWGRSLNYIQIYSPGVLKKNRFNIQKVFLAIPSLDNKRKRDIISEIKFMGYEILQVPSISEISSGICTINDLRPIPLEQLIGREEVNMDLENIRKLIQNEIICITGAGGSIGSEISRQILSLKPKKLILIEMSEPSLYSIKRELDGINKLKIPIKAILNDLSNQDIIEKIIFENTVNRIFHCAAYKHVPLVESNPLAGLSNNVISTFLLCKAAIKQNVGQLILISTDKAVRPSNIMGASKRIAEMVVQSFSNQEQSTIFSMVRFGNVIGSSGSVVPLFLEQIKNRSPLTITDENMTRYFMTIKEAASLVIQTIQYAKGGELFLLDMGKPKKIIDLAHQMIKLSGLKVRDNNNKNGDIEIKITGCRKGEKLYEELLIDAKCEATPHPRIFKANEKIVSEKFIFNSIEKLQLALEKYDDHSAIKITSDLVPEWENNMS